MYENEIQLIKEKAAQYAPEQLNILEQFASFDSETKYVEGNRKVVDIIRNVLSRMNVSIEERFFEGTGTHLIARIRPDHPDGRIILNSHLDTVFPVGFAAQNPWHIEGDYLYGLGTADCKGGFVVSCFAVKIMQELGLLPNLELTMIYSCDEEQGSGTAQKVFEDESKGADFAFVFEPELNEEPGTKLTTARKGVILGAMDIEGVEAHAGGAYLEGHSAIKELAHKILQYYSFNDYEKQIYYNVAPISGGRPNGVVAKDAHMEFCVAGIPDMDSWKQAEHNIDSLAESTEDPGCRVTRLEHHMLFPPMIRMPKAVEMLDLAAEAGKLLDIEVGEGVDPVAGDANYFTYFHVPSIDALGPVGSDIHTTNERVYIPSIQKKTELFAAILLLLRSSDILR